MTYSLADLHASGPPPIPMENWPATRAEINARWNALVGRVPDPIAPRWDETGREDRGSHTRIHLRYDTADGDQVPALLLVPAEPTSGPTGVRPGILALHPTSEDGKDDIATEHGRDNRRYALELVERGYVVLTPDTITAGERVAPGSEPFRTAGFVATHPDLSPVGKMIADHRQALSVLAAVGGVDPERLGAIGHSLGGYNAWFLAGADPRVAAVVSSCGFATFAGDADRYRWGERDWFSHLPALNPLLDDGVVPFEFSEILALVAPRPLFSYLAVGDEYFPHWRECVAGLDRAHQVYDGLGAGDQMISWIGHGGHDFPEHVRHAAYAFMDRNLREGR
ncbi:dienelactone hydrolase family protein [Actinopolymorpha alba]|uniref:dienelactone hydrolase family protein n=1 Tax=Actinopolymorpha alba TaxID=533267 RepID=UPI0003A18FAB|nr:dienelactone hydrolase family protein [Actinopolymorpha alba]